MIWRQHKNPQIPLKPTGIAHKHEKLCHHPHAFPNPAGVTLSMRKVHENKMVMLGDYSFKYPFCQIPCETSTFISQMPKESKAGIALHLWLRSLQRFSVGLPSWDRHWASPWQPVSWNVSERTAQMSEQPSHNSSTTYIHNNPANQWQTASCRVQALRRRAFSTVVIRLALIKHLRALTSPVTKYFPFCEKAKALKVFLSNKHRI